MDSKRQKIRDLVLGFLGANPEPDDEHTGAFLAQHPDLADALKRVLDGVREATPADLGRRVDELTGMELDRTMAEDPGELDLDRTMAETDAGEATSPELGSQESFDNTLDESGLGEATIAEAGATLPSDAVGQDTAPEAVPTGHGNVTGEPLFAGRYRFLRRLGAGGFGRVDLVADTWRKREKVALKVLLPQHLDKEEFGSRFQNEISVLRAMQHPGISQIYNDGRTETGEYYYTMEYVDGVSLEDVLDAEGHLGPQRIVRLVRQMIDILDYAHGQGVVHRDLKPANILIVNEGTENEQVKILDFGIAKIMRREGILEFAQTMETMAAMGTPHYMAPEQVRGKDIDPRADLYALGVIIYRMVSQRYPFKGKTAMEVATARIDQDPAPLEVDAAPSQLTTLVKQLLSRERADRPSHADIVKMLEQIADGQKDYRRLANQVMRVALVAIVVLSIYVIEPWTWFSGGGEEPRVATAPERAIATGRDEPSVRISDRAVEKAVADMEAPELFLVAADGESISLGDATEGDYQAAVEALDLGEGEYSLVARSAGSADRVIDSYVEDRTPPELRIDWSSLGEAVDEDGTPTYYFANSQVALLGVATDTGVGGVEVRIGNESVAPDLDGNFRHLVFDGVTEPHRVRPVSVTAKDRDGNESEAQVATFVYDGEAPRLSYRAGTESGSGSDVTLEIGSDVDAVEVVVTDRHFERLVVNGRELESIGDDRFSIDVSPSPSETLDLTAYDRSGNRTTGALTLELRPKLEQLAIGELDVLSAKGPIEAPFEELVVTARLNRDDREPSLWLDGQSLAIEALSDGSFRAKGAIEAGSMDLEVRVGNARLGVYPITRTPPRAPRGFSTKGTGRLGLWAERIAHDESGMTFVLVPPPAGAYVYRGDSGGQAVNVPVDLERPFYISTTEVTWGQFAASGLAVDKEPSFRAEVGDDHPVVGVGFEKAQAFCDWVGRSLESGVARVPTRAEWLHAAGGADAPAYPWGEAWDPDSCHWQQGSMDKTLSVLALDSDGWSGAGGFAGNVSEWCTDENGDPALAGGSWNSRPEQCRLTAAPPVFGTGGKNTVGIRVVLELE